MATAVGVVGLASTATAAVTTTEVVQFPITYSIYNPHNGDLVLIVSINLIKVGEDGSVINDDLHVHFTYTVRFDANGNYTTAESFDADCH